ncbi:MAG: hypothetical protein ABEN55_21595, partial [Bradymonadaceae bacterium]
MMTFAAMLGRHREAERLRQETLEIGEGVDRERHLPWVSVWGFVTNCLYQSGASDEKIQEVFARHAAFEVSPDEAVHHSMHGYVARGYARLAQASRADEATREEWMTRLGQALEALEAVSDIEVMECHALAVRGGYHRLSDQWQAAEETLETAVERSRADGNRWAEFEALRQQAELARERRREATARRTAGKARDLAVDCGWRHRVRELETRFDLDETAVEPEPEPAVPEPEMPEDNPAETTVLEEEPELEEAAALASMMIGTSGEASRERRIGEVLERFVYFVDATRAFLYVRDPETGAPVAESGRDRTGVELDPPAMADEELIAAALEGDERLATGVSPDRSPTDVDNVCVVALPPLLADRDPFAVLYADNLNGRRVLDPEQTEELLMLG